MHLEEIPTRCDAPPGAGRTALRGLSVLLLSLCAGGAVRAERAASGGEDEAAKSQTLADGQDRVAAPAPADASSDSDQKSDVRVAGSLSLRAGLKEGGGNDRLSARLGLEWAAGRWSGGFTAELENHRKEGALTSEEGIGSFDLSERWVAWTHEGPRFSVDSRLGTSFGLRFGEGLVLGSASFDGLSARVRAGRRWEITALAGRTDVLDPYDFFDESLDLLPLDDEFLGSKGELAGLRVQAEVTEGLSLGVNALRARADGSSWAGLASLDFRLRRGFFDLSGELATREAGGLASYLRGDFSPSAKWAIGFEHRHYDGFVSPVGNAPLYSGLSAGSDRDENGWLVRLDLLPSERFGASVSFDTSQPGGKESEADGVRRAHRLELHWQAGQRTALSYGLEYEDLSKGDDGAIHSLLATHSFADGGRLSGRLQVDRSSSQARETLRLNYRRPFLGRRITLLVDDSIRREQGRILNSLQVGASFRLAAASHLTVRATLADGEADGLDLTWYRRF